MIKIKKLILTSLILLVNLNTSIAQETEDINDVPDFFGEYIAGIETSEKAQSEAVEILEKNPDILRLEKDLARLNQKSEHNKQIIQDRITEMKKWQSSLKKDISDSDKTEKKNEGYTVAQQENTSFAKAPEYSSLQRAPLGLFWNISANEADKNGIKLKYIEYEGYTNTYKITNPQQKNNTFSDVYADFGAKDKLWCIIAHSKHLQDDKNGSVILNLYRKYYEALKQKYGNDKEFFTPHKYQHKIVDEKGQTINETKESIIGGENFREELQKNQTSLYASFNNKEIGVVLSVFADENGKTFITLTYKNFELMHEEERLEKQQEIPLDEL